MKIVVLSEKTITAIFIYYRNNAMGWVIMVGKPGLGNTPFGGQMGNNNSTWEIQTLKGDSVAPAIVTSGFKLPL